MIEQPGAAGSLLHCPSTPSILPPTNTNTPTSFNSNSLHHAAAHNLSPISSTPPPGPTTTPPTALQPAAAVSTGAVSHGTDVFSLGLLLLELASCIELPSSGSVWLDLRQGRAAGHVVGRVGSAAVEEVVLWCLKERVEERPSAEELIARLRGLVDVEKLRAIGVTVG